MEVTWEPGAYLFGPLLKSVGGAKYAAFYIDLRSRFVYVKELQQKTDHYDAFQAVVSDLKARSECPSVFQDRR